MFLILKPEAKSSPLFLWHNFNDFMEKEPCTKFCGVLTSSHEVMKLQSFESSMSDIILANVQHISFHPAGFFYILSLLWKKNMLHSFKVVLTISHELMKLWSFEWWNFVSTLVTTYMEINNMIYYLWLTQKLFEVFVDAMLFYD